MTKSDTPSDVLILESDILRTETGLTKEQVQDFFTKTPEDKIQTRPAKGGGQWKYVDGGYVTQVLNKLFGFNWSFTIKTSMEEALKTASTGTVVVQGQLTVKIGDNLVTKEQYGRKEIAFLTEGYKENKKPKLDANGNRIPLDFGNDMKAAATDAKKKCASELGLFADIYSQENFIEAEVVTQSEVDERAAQAVTAAIEKINEAKNTEALRQTFVRLGTLISNEEVIAAKDKRKQELAA